MSFKDVWAKQIILTPGVFSLCAQAMADVQAAAYPLYLFECRKQTDH
jgi:hypothetical protein